MSAQSSKKKRIGSRRRQANQNKEPDEFDTADNTSGAQHRSPEENVESFNTVANPDSIRSELQDPPSLELSGNRRKLGSSRRNRRGQHVEDLTTESHHKPKEEAEEKIDGNETLKTTRTSVATQLEGQEELGDDCEHDIVSAAHDSSLHLSTAPDYSSEIYNFSTMRHTEVDLESLNPKVKNLKAEHDEVVTDSEVVSYSHNLLETILEEIDKSDPFQREGVKDMADLDDISTLPSLGVVSNVNSGMAKEREDKDTDLLKPDGNSLISYLMSEPHVESVDLQFFITPEITTEGGSDVEQTGADYSIEQEMFPLAKEDISTNQEKKHTQNFSEVRGALYSDDGIDNEQEMQKTDFCESVTHYATENSELMYGNRIEKAEVCETHQSESTVEITDDSATKEENSNPDYKVLNKQEEEEIVTEVEESKSSLQTFEPAVNLPSDSQAQDNPVTIAEQTHTDFSLIGNRRKMGSSRRHKERKQVKDPAAEHEVDILQSHRGNGATEPTPMLWAIEASQDGLDQGSELDVIMPATHDSSVDSVITCGYSHEVQRLLSHEARGDHNSDDTVNKADDQEVKLEQMQEMPQANHSSEPAVHDATETSELIFGKNINQSEVSDAYQSELTDDLAAEQKDDSNHENKQNEHPTKENTFEAFDHRNEDDHGNDTKAPQVSDTESLDTISQIFEIKSTGEDDIKPSVENTSQVKEGLFSMEESYSSLQTLQSETHPPGDDTDFKSIGNTDSVDESYNRPTEEVSVNARDNEDPESTKMSSTIDTAVQEESVETVLEEVEEIDTTQTEEVADQIKGSSVVCISELRSLYQGSTVDQQLSNQSNLMEMRDDLPDVHSVTEKETEERDKGVELSKLGGDDQANYVVREIHEKSENIKISVSSEITTERGSTGEQTEPACNIEQTTLASPREELLTIEIQKEFSNLSGVESACHSEDPVNAVYEQEISPTQIQEDVTDNSKLISGQQIDKDAHDSELIVNGTDDSGTNQNDSNPDDKALNEHEKEEIISTGQETGQMLLTIDTMSQENLSLGGEFDIIMSETPDSSFHTANMSDFSYEVQDQPSTNYQEAEIESSLLKRENVQDYEESETSFYVEASDVSLDPALEEMEVTRVHYLEDAVNKMHKEEVEPEQIQKEPQIDHSSENLKIIFEKVSDQSEVSDTYQSVLIVQSPDDSAPKQEDLNPEDNQDGHLKKEDAFTALQLLTNDYYDTKKPQMSDTERVDSAQEQEYKTEDIAEDYFNPSVEHKGHQEKEGLYSEMEKRKKLYAEMNPPLVCQPQEDSVGREEQTHIAFTGNRRKMGSSRRLKGRKQVKDSAAEQDNDILQISEDNNALEPIQMLLEIDTSQEELGHGREHGVIMTATHGSFVDSAIMSDYLSEVQNSTTKTYQEAELESLIPKSENLQQDHGERETGWEAEARDASLGPIQEEMDKSDHHLGEEVRGSHHLEDTDSKVYGSEVEPELTLVPPFQNVALVTEHEDSKPEDRQNDHPTRENQYEALNHKHEVNQAEDTNTPQVSDTDRLDTIIGQVYKIKSTGDEDVKRGIALKSHQKKEGLFSEVEESDSSLQTLQSETHPPVDAQPEQNDTDFKSIGNRRKLGSSRRNKRRHHSPSRSTEGMTGKTKDEESLETTKISLTIESAVHEKSVETMLEEIDKADTTHTEEVCAQERADVGISELSHPSLHSSIAMDQQLRRRSDSVEMPDETEKGNKEREETSESTRHDGNVQGIYVVSESHETSEYNESCITQEIPTGNSSHEQHTEIVCSIEQASVSPSKESLFANEKEREHVNSSEVRVVLLSEDAENKDTQREETHQMCDSSLKESESSLQTVQSEINAPNETHQPLDHSNSVQDPQTHAGFNHTGNRKKFGSSRRNKGQLVVKETKPEPDEESEDKTRDSEAHETILISLATETMGQEELQEQTSIKPAEKIRKIRSTSKDKEKKEKMPGEMVLSQKGMENRIIEITDVNLSSNKDDLIKCTDAEENNIMNDTSEFTVYDTVKMDLIQLPEVFGWKEASGAQSLTYQGEIEQEEALQVKNTEPFSCETDKGMNVQKTNDAIETVGDISTKEHNTEEECLVDVHISEQVEVGEKFKDTKEGSKISVLENTHAEMFSASNNKTDSSALLSTGLEENIRAEQAVDSGKLLEKSTQKRRKMGSTRRTLHKKPDKEMLNEDGANESDINKERNKVTAASSQDENAKAPLVPGDKEQQEINRTGSVESSQLDDLTSPEIPPTAMVSETSNSSVNLLPSSNSEDATNTDITGESVVSICEATQSTQNDEERLKSGNATQDQALKSTEAPLVTVADLKIEKSSLEGGAGEEHKGDESGAKEPQNNMDQADNNANPEMKNPGPNLNPPHRRRKMGSTRRNLVPQTKGEDLHRKQEDNEATETVTHVEDEKTRDEQEILINVEEKNIDSERSKVRVLETVEYSQTGESQSKPVAHTFEEIMVSHGHPAEAEHLKSEQLTPDHLPVTPSTSPKQDTLSEIASAGRRRKLGSHRRSRGPQSNEKPMEEGDRITNTEGRSDEKTTEGHSLGLDKILEVEESDMKPSSHISTSKTGEHVIGKTPAPVNLVPDPNAGIKLVPDNLNLSLADRSSSSFNVVLVGDSSVGKTSYMKRAQSGKFSLEVPASIGLDTCKWTVLVNGKPVVLHLWDTAGQERFHSLTKQILHKAQAFLLMYDITSPQSFSAVHYWASCIKEGAAENVTILLLGNKSDHADRQVQTEEGEALAKENDFEFMECSAATGENVIQSLETVARRLNERVDTREEASVLHKEPQRKKTSGCC